MSSTSISPQVPGNFERSSAADMASRLDVTMDYQMGRSTACPEQHGDQLQLGFRLIQNAFNSKMQSLEQEVRGLRLTCDEQKSQVATQQKKNSVLETELVESHQRSQQLAEENKELFKTV